ncbi:hypothetical protein [Mycobacterium parmense]|uniref:Uncharacterized protein n=1 Tax=Mycobacterium parmense TaxID=185642 RepID=A0A7I7Z0F8_9MYCO|nr:hypothetical protein [Mycobacterium parmense]MCV7349977.1 hypothetical protein [Mycobacterium parmense]ORW59261.1 hypothetical protein AWC20_09950 [Mycobacterium parmense]BBZ46491.1 hypothetical protein MPRM_37720 [Mycobacterium parmense]
MSDNTAIEGCPHCGRRNRVRAAGPGKPRCAQCHRWLPVIVDAAPITALRAWVDQTLRVKA